MGIVQNERITRGEIMIHFCCLISCLGIGAGLGSTAEKPNVIIIFMDDLGYADIGPFGAT